MPYLTSIVAAAKNGAIGVDNHLPWKLKTDLAFFKKTTINNVVIMGRKTFQSLKGPLPGRYNIVLTRGFILESKWDNCQIVHSIDEALFASSRASKNFKESFVIGGASMYEQFSEYVDRYYVTIVDKEVPQADTYFKQSMIKYDEWDITPIASGVPNEAGDEAAFEIFELTALHSRDIESRRNACVAAFKAKVRSSQSKPSSKGNTSRLITPTPTMSLLKV